MRAGLIKRNRIGFFGNFINGEAERLKYLVYTITPAISTIS